MVTDKSKARPPTQREGAEPDLSRAEKHYTESIYCWKCLLKDLLHTSPE